MKKILLYIMALVALGSCVKPDERERDSDNELRSLKAYVYYDENNLKLYEEVDLLSGMYLADKGMASFTFPSDPLKYNGESKDCGIGNWHNLFNTSLYFNIIADNGDVKKYKIVCRCVN